MSHPPTLQGPRERERESKRAGFIPLEKSRPKAAEAARRRRGRSLSGFTLVELLIYVGIFSIAAGLFTGVLTTLTKVQVRESATTEVSQQAQFVIQTIQRLVTDASVIELASDTATSTLKLRMADAVKDPTCVQLSGGVVYLMEGNDGVSKQTCFATSSPQAKPLTDGKVVVNALTFTKRANPPAKDTVKIDLTVAYNSQNPQESLISRTLQTAITKISAATFDADIVPSQDNFYSVGLGAQRWMNGFFSNLLVGGYSSVTGGVAAFNGNVGIGTTSPGAKLDVSGDAAFGSLSGGSRVQVSAVGSPAYYTFGTTAGRELALYSAGAEVMRLQSGGNVGIGTSTPSNLLHVSAPAGQFTLRLDGPSGQVTGTELYLGTVQKGVVCIAGATNKCLGAGEGADEFIIQSDGDLSLWTGGIGSSNRRITITASGDVRINHSIKITNGAHEVELQPDTSCASGWFSLGSDPNTGKVLCANIN